MMKKVLLIIPCFNEADRIDLKRFESDKVELKSRGVEIVYYFADDGSKDETAKILQTYVAQFGGHVFSAPQNLGKANVIQAAFQDFKSIGDYAWIGYWDADLATPLKEVDFMFKYMEINEGKSFDAIWGSRLSRLGSDIRRKAYRHYLGRIFITVVSTVLGVKAYDSQCGAKLFTAKISHKAFKEPFISRWIFDVEILLRLQGDAILECPLTQWMDVPGSKVRIFREMFRVSMDLLKIRKAYLRG